MGGFRRPFRLDRILAHLHRPWAFKDGYLFPDKLFDREQPFKFVEAAKADGVAAEAGAAGAADAVDIRLGVLRDVVIKHVGQLGDIEAAGGYIGRDEYADLARAEAAQRLLARVLALVAVDGQRLDIEL